MANLLFKSARATIFEMLEDSRRLGACPGMIASLHTWGRTLSFHPHLHCILTDGGARGDGSWRKGGSSGLLPIRAASVLFRGKLLDAVRRGLERGALIMPAGMDAAAWAKLLRKLYAKKVNVFIQERYSDSRHVLAYLGRYVRGGPIGNRRLVSAEGGQVSFRYRDYRIGQERVMTLCAEEFLRRLLLHVPPRGLQCVRSYGLYANSSRITPRLELAPERMEKEDRASRPIAIRRCPSCGGPLLLKILPALSGRGFRAIRAPPRERLH